MIKILSIRDTVSFAFSQNYGLLYHPKRFDVNSELNDAIIITWVKKLLYIASKGSISSSTPTNIELVKSS